MVFQTWNHEKKKAKRKAILLLAYIADVSYLTNRSFLFTNIVFNINFNYNLPCNLRLLLL